MKYLKLEIQKSLVSIHDRLQCSSQREGVQTGGKKAAAAVDKFAGYIQEGIQEVCQNEYTRRSVRAAVGTTDTIRNDEQMKEGIRKLKKGILKAAEVAFQGLKCVLDIDEDGGQRGQQVVKKTTIYDVAKEADVSLVIVSRVINGSGVMCEDTCVKVQEAIEELGYKPNAITQGLALQRITTVALIIPEVSYFYIGQVVSGLIGVAKICKYNVMLYVTTKGIAEANDITENIIKSRVDGVVISSDKLNKEELDQLTRYQVPVAVIDSKASDDTVGGICVDYANLVHEYVSGCTKQGRKNITPVEDRENPQMIKQLLDGLNRAFEEQRMKSGGFIQIPKEYCSSYLSLREHMKQGICYDIVIAYHGSQAMVVMNTAKEAGIGTLDEMELVCILNSKYSVIVCPQISGFKIPNYDLGVVVMRLLTRTLHDKSGTTDKEIELSHIYIPRKSAKQDQQFLQ